MKNKTIFIVVIIALLITGVFFLSKKGQVSKQNNQPPEKIVKEAEKVEESTPSPSEQFEDWQTHEINTDPFLKYSNYIIKTPLSFKRIEHSSNFQNMEVFKDEKEIYNLTIKQIKNQSYKSLEEFLEISSGFSVITVADQRGIKIFKEINNIDTYQALFFTPDKKMIFDIKLEVRSKEVDKKTSELLFDKIISTFILI